MDRIKETLAAFAEKVKEVWGKVVSFAKANPKKIKIACGAVAAAVVLLIGGIIGIGFATNNYKTPVKIMQKYANAKRYYSSFDRTIDMANGFCEDELKAIVKLMKSNEDYKDDLADAKEDFADDIQDLKDEYGKNYKITYKVTDKDKIDKDDLKEVREELRDYADALEEMIEETDDYDSDEWEELAEEIGLDNKSAAKKVVRILKDMRKEYRSARVTAGYELEITVTTTGSELDEPIENEISLYVYKVNGRWIASSFFLGGIANIF